MLEKTTVKDSRLAIAVTLAGGVALIVAHRAHWQAQDMSPGIEGCLTTSVLGSIVLLLHPLRYASAVVLSVPLLVGEYLACAFTESSAVGLGMVGVHLVIVGFLGIALTLREPRPSARPARASRRLSPPASTSPSPAP